MGRLQGFSPDALTLLKTVTLGADAALLTIPAIPGGYNDLVLFAQLRGTMAAAGANCHIQFNGDVAANYEHQYLLGGNVSFSSAAANNTYGLIGTMPAANALAASMGMLKAEIIGYALADRNKELLSESHWRGAIATDQSRLKAGVQWLSLAPITQIDLFAQSLNIKVGSTAWLYGRL